MKLINIFLILIVTFLLFSCSPKKEMLTEKWFDNPNGQSELALTMREMFDALAIMKYKIENDKKVKDIPNFDNLLTAVPTDASMKNDTYVPFAKAWLAHLDAMKSTTKVTQAAQYKNLVNSCIACHNNSCPGPIMRIEKLYITKP